MAERWVLNSSPLILLAQAKLVDLLHALVEEAVIPVAVATEIRAGPVDDPARRWIEAGSLSVIATPTPTPELLAWDLGAGETAVLAYAMASPGWVAVLDDAAARKCAQSFAIPLIGTLAIIVRARQQGLIPSAVEAVQALQLAGFRIDERIVRTVLKETVGEDWPTAEK